MLFTTDNYVLWFWASFLMVIATALYYYRNRWVPAIARYQHINQSFEDDVEAGLSSEDFDLSGNIADGDSRGGLDVQAKKEVLKIMKSRKVNFDEARRIFMEQRLAKNGIAPDGRPTDPRAVFFS
ncbi:hypothetical protein RUND412_009176 [Rhizina undulata]